MIKILLILSALIVIIFLVLLNIDFVSSIVPGWNTTLPPYYLIYFPAIFFNILIPSFLYFSFREIVTLRIIIGYFTIVNIIFLYAKISNYFLFRGGSITLVEIQKNLIIQMTLIFISLFIHFLIYMFLIYKKQKQK